MLWLLNFFIKINYVACCLNTFQLTSSSVCMNSFLLLANSLSLAYGSIKRLVCELKQSGHNLYNPGLNDKNCAIIYAGT
jgi:hypothetical protein